MPLTNDKTMTPTPLHEFSSLGGRCLFTLLGGVLGAIEHSLPLMLIVILAILLDAITAWRLSRRVRRSGAAASGKFKSKHFGRVISTMWLVCSLILLAGMIQQYPIFGVEFPLARIIMMAVCFWQIWSILENESSCNGASWAKFLQRIMVDKTGRHLDIDLDKTINEVTDKDKKDEARH